MKVFDYINNNDLYENVSVGLWRNIRTGKEGEVDESKAKSIFTINKQATQLISEYPLILDLIKTLGLKIEK